MDVSDQATQQEEMARAAALNAQKAIGPKIWPDGACHNCDEHLAPSLLFCDADCRDDYQKRNPSSR